MSISPPKTLLIENQPRADGPPRRLRRAPVVICHPVWQLGRGGLERQLLQLLQRLPADNFRHILAVRGWTAEEAVDLAGLGDNVRIICQSGGQRRRLWPLQLARLLREHRVDALHVRGLSMLPDSLLAARLCGNVAVAFSFHGFEKAGRRFGWWRRRLYRAAVRRCDHRWAVGPSAAQAVATELNLPDAGFEVLPNGVDTERYRPAPDKPALRRRLGLPTDRLIVLTVGNLKPIKGHDVLLEAIRRLGLDADQATFVFAGKDCLDGSLASWARAHLARCDVRFIGEQPDVLPWYQAADFFVLPSRYEGLSNALLEAMGCALPVIVTAVGGNNDVVEQDRTGLLVNADEPAQLASSIRLLLGCPAHRARLAEAARQHVCRCFGIQHTVTAYARCYALLGRREGSASDARFSPRPSGEGFPGLIERTAR